MRSEILIREKNFRLSVINLGVSLFLCLPSWATSHANILGTWKTKCVVAENGSTSFEVYEISEKKITAYHLSFSDGACQVPTLGLRMFGDFSKRRRGSVWTADLNYLRFEIKCMDRRSCGASVERAEKKRLIASNSHVSQWASMTETITKTLKKNHRQLRTILDVRDGKLYFGRRSSILNGETAALRPFLLNRTHPLNRLSALELSALKKLMD